MPNHREHPPGLSPDYHHPPVGLSKAQYEVAINAEDAEWLRARLNRHPDAVSLFDKIFDILGTLRSIQGDASRTLKLGRLPATWLYKNLWDDMIDCADRKDAILLRWAQERADRLTTDYEFALTTNLLPDNRHIVIHKDKPI